MDKIPDGKIVRTYKIKLGDNIMVRPALQRIVSLEIAKTGMGEKFTENTCDV